jgi:arsenate reductase (thioredoxin)
VKRVLFLCTGNSARSILAEGLLREQGAGCFEAFSAGSQPKGQVNPWALETLRALGYSADGFRSKSWDEFAVAGAEPIDIIITVCDNAAGEACPLWPGHPTTAHWGVADPAAVEGADQAKRHAFAEAAFLLQLRIGKFLSLPVENMDASELQRALREIGEMEGATHGV